MSEFEGWELYHPDTSTRAERAIILMLLILVTILNLYALAKLMNAFRTLWYTKFLTSKPLQGGHIAEGSEPKVTIQICCYNEQAVIEATINAACSVDWPKDKLFVQILDDSTDNTSAIVQDLAASWREKGVNCVCYTRPTRRGYKAGNLYDMDDKVVGDFVALFDADHRCDVNFLRRTVPHFFNKDGSDKPEIGLVQVPWAYYNAHANLLTKYDALNLDLSHVIEQQGRSAALQCFGFNGTGGIWRHAAIHAGGGWQWDTVVEDLDLSYLAHLGGYKFVYLRDLPQQLELPSSILAHKQQKHRWTKGFWQVLRKSLWNILENKKSSIWLKLEAFFHMSCAIANPITLVVMVLVSMASYQDALSLFMALYCLAPFASYSFCVIITCYGKVTDKDGNYRTFWSRTKRIGLLPVMIMIAVGISVYETFAVYEGIVSDDATFLRTPKEGSKNTTNSSASGANVNAADEEVMENVIKSNKKKRGGFATEMFAVLIGLFLSSYFAAFAVYSLVSKRFAAGAAWFVGYMLPAVGLAIFHLTMLRVLLKYRAADKKTNRDEINKSTKSTKTEGTTMELNCDSDGISSKEESTHSKEQEGVINSKSDSPVQTITCKDEVFIHDNDCVSSTSHASKS
ncbi:hypothetical protein ACA910_017305 [Epithemia clementina (nom. ined.)]